MKKECIQLDLFDSLLVVDALPESEDGDQCDPPVVHSIVRAADCLPPQCAGPVSVFSLGESAIQLRTPLNYSDKRWNAVVVTRDTGVVRCSAVRFAETEEGMEKERQRRARQIVPKAKKQTFKMRNSRTWDDPQS